MRPDGTGIKRLTTAPGNDSHSSWSPDGKHILWSSARYGFKDEAALYDNAFQPFAQIFMMNADGSDQRVLTTKPVGRLDARGSPAERAEALDCEL